MNLKESSYVIQAKKLKIFLKLLMREPRQWEITNYKLQMITSRFEEIRMLEDESLDEFDAKFNDIVNCRFNLWEKIED